MDSPLLESAREAGARLAEAERQAVLARADYHTAIRRLHLAGTPLREIAQMLSLSHQRVQQIVSARGGSWWQVWRRRGTTGDAVCTWCGRPPAEVHKLIAGPKIYICDSCVESAERVIAGRPTPGLQLATAGARTRCSFCRKRADGDRSVVAGPANACGECLRICREILTARA
jgi:ClpX C4-type zinc finger